MAFLWNVKCLLADFCLRNQEVKDRGEVRDSSQSTPQLCNPKGVHSSTGDKWIPHPGCPGSRISHTFLQPWSGNQQSCQPSSKLTGEIWKPLPKTKACILLLTSVSAKGQSRSLYISSTTSQNVQKACSQIKLQFTELDVVDGTGFQMQSSVTGSDLQV